MLTVLSEESFVNTISLDRDEGDSRGSGLLLILDYQMDQEQSVTNRMAGESSQFRWTDLPPFYFGWLHETIAVT